MDQNGKPKQITATALAGLRRIPKKCQESVDQSMDGQPLNSNLTIGPRPSSKSTTSSTKLSKSNNLPSNIPTPVLLDETRPDASITRKVPHEHRQGGHKPAHSRLTKSQPDTMALFSASRMYNTDRREISTSSLEYAKSSKWVDKHTDPQPIGYVDALIDAWSYDVKAAEKDPTNERHTSRPIVKPSEINHLEKPRKKWYEDLKNTETAQNSLLDQKRVCPQSKPTNIREEAGNVKEKPTIKPKQEKTDFYIVSLSDKDLQERLKKYPRLGLETAWKINSGGHFGPNAVCEWLGKDLEWVKDLLTSEPILTAIDQCDELKDDYDRVSVPSVHTIETMHDFLAGPSSEDRKEYLREYLKILMTTSKKIKIMITNPRTGDIIANEVGKYLTAHRFLMAAKRHISKLRDEIQAKKLATSSKLNNSDTLSTEEESFDNVDEPIARKRAKKIPKTETARNRKKAKQTTSSSEEKPESENAKIVSKPARVRKKTAIVESSSSESNQEDLDVEIDSTALDRKHTEKLSTKLHLATLIRQPLESGAHAKLRTLTHRHMCFQCATSFSSPFCPECGKEANVDLPFDVEVSTKRLNFSLFWRNYPPELAAYSLSYVAGHHDMAAMDIFNYQHLLDFIIKRFNPFRYNGRNILRVFATIYGADGYPGDHTNIINQRLNQDTWNWLIGTAMLRYRNIDLFFETDF